MIYAVKIGTASWRSAETLGAGEVGFVGVPGPNMIWDAGLNNMRTMTAPEIAALPAQLATAAAVDAKAAATVGIDNGDAVAGDKLDRIVRAVALVALDAFNTDRTAMAAMSTAVAAAVSLADLKTRWALISIPPQVTAAQLVTAIKSKIAASAQ